MSQHDSHSGKKYSKEEARKGCGDCFMQDCQWPKCMPKSAGTPTQAPLAGSQPAPVLDYPPLPDLISSVWPFIHTNAAADSAAMVAKTSDQVDAAIHTLLRAYVDADRAARAPAESVQRDALPTIKGASITGGYVVVTPAGWGDGKAAVLRDAILRTFPVNPAFSPKPDDAAPAAKGGA